NVEPEADVVSPFGPVRVADVMELWIVPVVRHERVVDAEVRIVADREPRHPAFKAAWTIGAWNSEVLEAELFIQPSLLDVGVHQRVTEVAVKDEVRRERIRCRDGCAVGPAEARSGVAARAADAGSAPVAEGLLVEHRVSQHA